MTYDHPVFPAFVLAFSAFVLLVLTTFSVPFVSSFYFLDSTMAGGVRFGIWGWCLDSDGTCSSPLQLGYDWSPEVMSVLTRALVFYPISAAFTLLSVISIIPLLCSRSLEMYQYGVFSVCALISFITSFIAFIFMIALWGIAMSRFRKAGFDATFGPLPWMSLTATIALMLVTVNSGCGSFTVCSTKMSRRSARRQMCNY